jgi:hypothetical protein
VRAVLTDDRSEHGEDVPISARTRGGSRPCAATRPSASPITTPCINLEYRFPVWDLAPREPHGIDGAVFWDCGTAVRNLEDVHQHDSAAAAARLPHGERARLIGRRDFA